jgi:mannitol/fructose-specific phosphotransferase system IIA component (Ntr-type)
MNGWTSTCNDSTPPHFGRSKATAVAIGQLALPIDFGALDGRGTDSLVLLLARSERDLHALLAKVARRSREVRYLRTLPDAQEIADTIAFIRYTEDRVFAPVS